MAQSDTCAGAAARIRERLARLDAERTDLEKRLAELARSSSMPLANANPGGTVTNRSPHERQDRVLPDPLRRSGGRISPAMGERREGQSRVRTGLRQRVEARRVPQAPGALRRLPQPGL